MKNLLNNLFANVRKIATLGIVCMLFLTVISCESTKEELEEEFEFVWDVDRRAMIGKWQLLKVEIGVFHERIVHDYSQYEVIFEFKESDILAVSKSNAWLEAGSYLFSVGLSEEDLHKFSSTHRTRLLPFPYVITIDGIRHSYYSSATLLEGKMIIFHHPNGSPHYYYLVKIN